jgi:hypothetical protein
MGEEVKNGLGCADEKENVDKENVAMATPKKAVSEKVKLETMTITRALQELKLLDSRIKKSLEKLTFLDVYTKEEGVCIDSRMEPEDFKRYTESRLQSVETLIRRRSAIKSAIILSNAATRVKILDEEYTVAEAIDRRTSIQYEQRMLEVMKEAHGNFRGRLVVNAEDVNARIDGLVEQATGKEGKNIDLVSYEQMSKPIVEARKFILADPLILETKIDLLDKKIDRFLSEVDLVLSESNSVTQITL